MNELGRSIESFTPESIQTRRKNQKKREKQEKIIDNPQTMLYNIIINNKRKIHKGLGERK